uniref:Uncharacterized protein n=1 Tax=Arundo donax TaxID=35708 RepID=A0A0A8YNC0_ARUDO
MQITHGTMYRKLLFIISPGYTLGNRCASSCFGLLEY